MTEPGVLDDGHPWPRGIRIERAAAREVGASEAGQGKGGCRGRTVNAGHDLRVQGVVAGGDRGVVAAVDHRGQLGGEGRRIGPREAFALRGAGALGRGDRSDLAGGGADGRAGIDAHSGEDVGRKASHHHRLAATGGEPGEVDLRRIDAESGAAREGAGEPEEVVIVTGGGGAGVVRIEIVPASGDHTAIGNRRDGYDHAVGISSFRPVSGRLQIGVFLHTAVEVDHQRSLAGEGRCGRRRVDSNAHSGDRFGAPCASGRCRKRRVAGGEQYSDGDSRNGNTTDLQSLTPCFENLHYFSKSSFA